MRTLSSTLLAAQKKTLVNPLVKVVLTDNGNTYTYTKSRIIDVTYTVNGSLQSAEVILSNADGELTEIDLRGFKAVLSRGLVTSAGEELSACADMWVTAQKFDSEPNSLKCTLILEGIFKMMAEDKASESYMPDEDDTKSVKTLLNEILTATMTCFDHCDAYTVEWDVGYDPLADSYKPKDGFRIYTGGDRLAAVERLLDFTKNVAVAKNDGKIHIFKPVTTGTSYDYEYSLEAGHPFFAKALRNRLVIPNYIGVESYDEDDPSYGGYAIDSDSHDKLPKREFYQMKLTSNQEAEDIAAAILAKAQMWCEAGSASVPPNVGQEAFDYVKVTDKREDDFRVGNIGQIVSHYTNTGKRFDWRMTIVFGNWQNARKALAGLNLTADELVQSFSRLKVGSLYAEHIITDQLDIVWIDPDGNIDLTQIGDDLDNLADGSTYARVKSVALSVDGLVLLDQVVEGTYGKVLTTDISAGHIVLSECSGDLDDIANGGTYEKVLATDIQSGHIILSACTGDLGDIDDGGGYGKILLTDIDTGHIKLTSNTVWNGKVVVKAGVTIDSTNGITIFGTTSGLRTRATEEGANQCYVGTDGSIMAGAGNVLLNASGIQIKGQSVLEFYSGSTLIADLGAAATHVALMTEDGKGITLSTTGVSSAGAGITIWAENDEPLQMTGKIYMQTANRLVVPNCSSEPSSPEEGTLVRNNDSGSGQYRELMFYTNSQWYRCDLIGVSW